MDRSGTKKAIKVVLLGNSGAGKSSLAQRFVFNTFNHYSESTIGASFFTKHMDVKDEEFDKLKLDQELDVPPRSMKFHGELF
jgi:GTPase SAR1 family protein